jgi:hypothetical protein
MRRESNLAQPAIEVYEAINNGVAVVSAPLEPLLDHGEAMALIHQHQELLPYSQERQ